MGSMETPENVVRPGGPAWVLKAGLALLINLVVWEVLLRLFILSPIAHDHMPGLGWLPLPHEKGLVTEEGRGVCTYNAHGFRDAEVEPPRAGVERILVLGDSYIEGRQVAQDELSTSRLQAALNKDAGRTVARVFNAGRVGVVPSAHVAYADVYKKIFQPDWVVVQVEDGRWEVFSKQQEAYYVPQGDGFKIETNWRKKRLPLRYKLMRRSKLDELAVPAWTLHQLTEMTGGARDNAAAAGPAARDGAAAGDGLADDPATQRDPGDPEAEGGPRSMDRVIGWTMHELRRAYPNLVVVHVPGHSERTMGLLPVQPEEKLVARYCQKEGIPLIRMRDRIASDYDRTGIPPFGFSNSLPWAWHTNAHGHELISEALREFFEKDAAQLKRGVTAQPTADLPGAAAPNRLDR